jgi:hypothetical protein
VLQTLVVVVHRHGQSAFGFFLANDVVVQIGFDVQGGGQTIFGVFGDPGGWQLIANDVVAQINALVANEDRRSGDELFDLVLAFAAEGAVQILFGNGAFFIGHKRRPVVLFSQ